MSAGGWPLWGAEACPPPLEPPALEPSTGVGIDLRLQQPGHRGAWWAAISGRAPRSRLAKRSRSTVLGICDELKAAGGLKGDDVFWVEATLIEALLGLGRAEESDALLAKLLASDPPPVPWMVATLQEQLTKLRALLQPKA
jgi:hypothetical protein